MSFDAAAHAAAPASPTASSASTLAREGGGAEQRDGESLPHGLHGPRLPHGKMAAIGALNADRFVCSWGDEAALQTRTVLEYDVLFLYYSVSTQAPSRPFVAAPSSPQPTPQGAVRSSHARMQAHPVVDVSCRQPDHALNTSRHVMSSRTPASRSFATTRALSWSVQPPTTGRRI